MASKKDPARLQRLFEQAADAFRRGDLAAAEQSCRQLLKADPHGFAPRHLMGVIKFQQGDADAAVEHLAVALRIQPADPGAGINYGLALMSAGRAADALPVFDRVLAARADFVEAWFNRGLALAVLGRPEEALASYDRALALRPGHAGAHYNRGVALSRLRHFPQAVESYDRALAIQPGSGAALGDRGIALFNMGQYEAALDSLDRALALQPNHAAMLSSRGLVLSRLGRLEAALASYDAALAQAPSDARTCDYRGSTLWSLGLLDAALESFDAAIALAPDFADALNHRGTLLASMGRAADAARDLERAVALDPGQPYALGELLHLKLYVADWRDYDAQAAAIETGLKEGCRVVRPFTAQAVSQSPAELQTCSRLFAEDLYPAVAPRWTRAQTGRGHDRLRIGYVSGEFHEQATAYLMAGLYERHDRAQFEIVAFDNGIDDGSAMRARLEAAFDRMVPIAGLSSADAAACIRAAEIDVLVNLNGYFGKDSTGVFALRPAPVQVNYLGFPATMGTPCMDYILADFIVLPPDEQRFYTEAVAWLPDCYQANDSRRAIAPGITREQAGLPESGFVFCNFNQSYKLAPAAFTAWMDILKAVPGSVLWLLQGPDGFADNLRREAQARGVEAARLVFAPLKPHGEHLARLKLADLFLDALPYNAHTTASDALWAGTPLLTCRGTAFAGRVAASLLLAAGLPDLVTENMAGYRALAIRLAGDSAALAGLRARLAASRASCALFDTARFARHIESAYRTMWAQRGDAPRAFAVGP